MSREYLPVRGWMVHRPRINALLEKGLGYPLVNVVAGEGYGKSLAVAGFCATTTRSVVWLPIVEGMDEPRVFWLELIEAARRELPTLAQMLEAEGFPESHAATEELLRGLTRRLETVPGTVLVLDNAERIHNPKLLHLLNRVVSAGLQNLCVILIRNRRMSGLSSLGEGKQMHLSAAELRFNEEETRQLYAAQGAGRTPEGCKIAVNSTEGWPLALYLSCSQPAGPAGSFGDMPHLQILAEMFERHHYANYPGDIRALLVKLSFFRQFSASLVKAIGTPDLENAVYTLSREIFLSYDYTSALYCFQKSYREFLALKQAMLDDADVERVHRAAGAWFRENGRPWEAMDCFWRLGEYGLFLDTAAEIPHSAYKAGDAERMLARLDRFPPEYREQNAQVDFCRGLLFLYNGRLNLARRLFEGLAERLEGEPGTARNRAMLVEVCSTLSRICLWQNRPEELVYLRRAVALSPADSSLLAGDGQLLGDNEAFSLPGNTPGSLEKGLRHRQACAAVTGKSSWCHGAGLGALYTAEAFYYQGNMGQALEHAQKAKLRASASSQHDIYCNARLLQVRVALYNGDDATARQQLRKLDAYLEEQRREDLEGLRRSAHALRHYYLEEYSEMARHLAVNVEAPTAGPPAGRDKLLRAVCLLARQHYVNAHMTLLALEEDFRERSLWCARLYAHIIKAACQQALGSPERATAELWSAYSMAHSNHLPVFFAEFGNSMLALLEAARAQSVYTFEEGWLAEIRELSLGQARRRSAMRKHHSGEPPPHRAEARLTTREEEVLRYLAEGLSRNEIGELMDISVHGVKKHIANIYTKLGAVNRAEAVHIAMASGILAN